MSLSISGVQGTYNEIHKLFMIAKLSHYNTKSYAAHGAFGRIYDALDDLIDSITEKLIGYSGIDPINLELGTITAVSTGELSEMILKAGKSVITLAKTKDYPDIENLGQELSGLGAQLKYLVRFP